MTTDQWIIAALIGSMLWMAMGELELRLIRKRLDAISEYVDVISAHQDTLDELVGGITPDNVHPES